MKKIAIALLILILRVEAFSQSCLPEGITFSYPSQIEYFQYEYPGCSQILGNVIIGEYIGYLGGLSVLTFIGGDLTIQYNTGLTNLMGLDNLTGIGGDLTIRCNPPMTSLMGLDKLTNIGGDLIIQWNDNLTNLTGLENLMSIGGNLFISRQSTPTFLIGLENLTSIGGKLELFENILTSLVGLENLTSIGGDLVIHHNLLNSLIGIDNINAGSITNLYIHANEYLTTCQVKSVCDYLAVPNGITEIYSNATGCNSQQEVETACGLGLYENGATENYVNIHPNPSSTDITIELPTTPYKNTILTIYNINGQQLLTRQITRRQTVVDVSGLPQGVYFVSITNDRTVEVLKVVKQFVL